MLIQCPRCQTKYNLDEALLSPAGSQVRCSRCGHEFQAEPPTGPGSEPPRTPEPPPPPPEDDLMDFLGDDGKPIKGLDLDEDQESPGGSLFKKILAILIILIVCLGLLLGGLLFLKSRGVNLDEDYLGINLYDYLTFLQPREPVGEKSPAAGGEKPQDPGNKRIHLAGVNGSFLDLEEQGQIFLIKGKVKNAYDHPVTEIRLRGILHTKDRRNAAESIVFAGHLLSDEEIKSLSRSVIEGILTNPQAAEETDVGTKPGETVDFMIVFFDLPENLLEYTVEVVSSRSMSKQSD